MRARTIALATVAVHAIAIAWRSCARDPSSPAQAPGGFASPSGGDADTELTLAEHSSAAREHAESEHASADADALEIEVLQSDRTPLADAEVYLVVGQDVSKPKTTDARGVARFDARERGVDVYVLSGTALRARRTLDSGAGRHTIELEAGTPLVGTVILDGKPPGAPFALQLTCEDRKGGLEFVPDVVLDAEGRETDEFVLHTYTPWFVVRTDADGRFRVDGLLPTWSGTLRVGDLFLLEDERTSLELDAPRSDLVLRVRSRPVLRGRIVDPFDRRGVQRAHVEYVFDCDDGAADGTTECDADGRFAVRLPCPIVRRARIGCRIGGLGAGGIERSDVPFEGADVGDIVLAAERAIAFTARDTRGGAIAGATVSTETIGWIRSAPSDASGRGGFGVPKGSECALVCRARGYADARALLAPDASAVDFALEPLPGYEIRVRSMRGALPMLMRVLVASWDAEPFVIGGARRADPDESALVLGSMRMPRTRAEESDPAAPSVALAFPVPPDGVVRIPGLVPRAAVELGLVDVAGTRIAAQRVEPPAEPSLVTREIVLDAELRTLELAIVRPDGAPVIGARVRRAGEARVIARSGREGVATLEGLIGSQLRLTVRGHGFAPKRLDLALTGERTRRDVIVEPGRTVAVRIVDARGKAVAASSVGAHSPDGEPLEPAYRISEGHYEARDAPLDAFVVRACVGGVSLERTCAPGESAVELDVPDVGKLRLEFDPPLTVLRQYSILVESRAAPRARVHELVAERGASAVVELPAVLAGVHSLEVQSRRGDGGGVTLLRRDGVQIRAGETTTLRYRGDDFRER